MAGGGSASTPAPPRPPTSAGARALAQLRQDPPTRAHVVRVPDRLPQALKAPVRMGERALLLRVRLRWEDHVGVLLERLAPEAGEGDHAAGALHRSEPLLALAQ